MNDNTLGWEPGSVERGPVRSTTILCVRHHGHVAIAADGQMTVGTTIMKRNSRKIRRIYHDRVVAGFAGATADALTLFEKFEQRVEEFRGNLARASVEMAKDWRTDRVLRRLEALMAVADQQWSFIITGSGDVVEPEDGIIAIGSGGGFALAAARALLATTDMNARDVVMRAMKIAAGIDIYTNDEILVEELAPE